MDTPAGLVARAGGEQRLIFHTDDPVEGLRALPEVASLTRNGGEVTVTGTGDLLSAVAAVLPPSRTRGLRMERTTLDDAFLVLTGKEES